MIKKEVMEGLNKLLRDSDPMDGFEMMANYYLMIYHALYHHHEPVEFEKLLDIHLAAMKKVAMNRYNESKNEKKI